MSVSENVRKAAAHPVFNSEELTEPDGSAGATSPKEPGSSHGASAGAKSAGDPAAEAPPPPEKLTYVQELEAKVHERDERLQATLGQYKEALDDFNRTKVRLKRDIDKEIEAGKRSLLGGLLEVIDNLERALDAASGDSAQAQTSLCLGVTMVRDQFRAKLEQLGVRKLSALGEPFDPAHFEAIANVPVDSADKDGMVMGVVRDAYVIGGDTLRHGMVAVGKHAAS